MTETFVALLFAHVAADFLLQPGWMVARKRSVRVLLLHAAVVLATAQAAVGLVAAAPLLALAAAHLAIDAAKAHLTRGGLAAFLGDQAAHLAVLVAVALSAPDLWAGGLWAGGWASGIRAGPGAAAPLAVLLPHLMLWVAGFVLATRAGGFAVGLLMARQAAGDPPKGLPKGGAAIGLLERGLIYLMTLAGQPEATGFLIAAKSILRFGTVAEDRAASEYVIIGTLASFGWAIAVTLGVETVAALLPPLEIVPRRP